MYNMAQESAVVENLYVSPVVLVFTTLVIGILSLITKRSKPVSNVPGPFPWPVLGNLLSLGKKPHVYLTELRQTYGDVYQIMMGSSPTVILNGMRTIKQALVRQADDFAGRPDFYTFRYIANGKSMGFCDFGPRWKMHRRIAQNALAPFTSKKNSSIEEAVIAEAELLTNIMLKSNGKPFNPHDEIYLSVGNIICALCFGKRYSRDDKDFLHLVKMDDEFMKFIGAGNPVDIMPWMRHFTKKSFNRFVGILKRMDDFCLNKRKEHVETYSHTTLRDVTDALIRATEETSDEDKLAVGLTDEHILTTVQEIIGAGFDTTASTLQWSLLFMITHPNIQEKIHVELKTNVGLDRYLTTSDLPNLPFTEACILEVLRHSCIFPFALPHSTTKDTYINGHFIKEKTLIFVNLWSVSHDPEIFPNPDIYDPYRFLTPDGKVDRNRVEWFLPFGTGRRKCPGEQLARIELFLFFATLLQRCKFERDPLENPRIDCKYGLTLKPLDFNVIVSKRNI